MTPSPQKRVRFQKYALVINPGCSLDQLQHSSFFKSSKFTSLKSILKSQTSIKAGLESKTGLPGGHFKANHRHSLGFLPSIYDRKVREVGCLRKTNLLQKVNSQSIIISKNQNDRH